MRCAVYFTILGVTLTMLGTTVPAIGQVVDASTMFAKLMAKVSSKSRDSPLTGLLYPQESESREVKSLDGLWDFTVSPSGDSQMGRRNLWFSDELSKSAKVMQMPVPSSYNDVTTSQELRDHVGAVWYERNFFVPKSWSEQRVFVRFGSVNYLAEVWINGELVAMHEMGHLPFEAEITEQLNYGSKNRITVAVDNSLLPTSIPQGSIHKSKTDNGTAHIQTYSFDFFNYAGIHRPVLLYTTPRVFVDDITVKTSIIGTTGVIKFSVHAEGLQEGEIANCSVILRKADGTLAVNEEIYGFSGTIKVPEAKLWWPIGMHPEPAYLHTLEVTVSVENVTIPDVYRLPVGIRSLRWTNTSVLVNEKPIYMRGFGRHEDSPIRGRGLDLVTMTRDHELLKWVGANSYRTSHYPYSDEVLDMADRQGILIINECPAVDIGTYSSKLLKRRTDSIAEFMICDKNGASVLIWSLAIISLLIGSVNPLTFFYLYFLLNGQGFLIINECPAVNVEDYSSELLALHKASLSELIRRDKNRPSVIMWSIANEPRSSISGSEDYYRKISQHTKTLDPTRPITAAIAVDYSNDKAAQFLDVIGFNRYNAWYSNPGRLDLIINKIVNEAIAWNKKHDKPIMILEYGGDTMEGLHELPSYIWSEEYQKELFARHFMAFDRLRLNGFFIGEFIWNFADFRTAQTYTRVGGNKKGIFTRTREPKLVAHHVRKRYHTLGVEIDGSEPQPDLEDYITGNGYNVVREEL